MDNDEVRYAILDWHSGTWLLRDRDGMTRGNTPQLAKIWKTRKGAEAGLTRFRGLDKACGGWRHAHYHEVVEVRGELTDERGRAFRERLIRANYDWDEEGEG